jgi:hypothetical protein
MEEAESIVRGKCKFFFWLFARALRDVERVLGWMTGM